MESELMKVGELAERSGVSVRALHHYDEIGLLSPSGRSAAGHRLYSEDDAARLLSIRSLQQMGFSLGEIRSCLDDRAFPLARVLEMHVARLREQLDQNRRLCQRLESGLELLRAERRPPLGEILKTIEDIDMFEKYYTPEQLAALKKRGEELGPDAIKAVEAEWPQLIAAVREEKLKGTPPSDPKVRALAKRWRELVEMFTGGDPGVRESLARLYQNEPQMNQRAGIDPAIVVYVNEAMGKS